MNNKYWRERSAARMDRYQRDGERTVSVLSRAYSKAMRDIEEDAERILRAYTRAYRLSEDEALALLKEPCGRAEYEKLLARIAQVTDEQTRNALQARAASGAYANRLSRLEALKTNIAVQVARLGEIEQTLLTQHLSSTVKNAYMRSMYDVQRAAGYGFDFARMNQRTVGEILHNPWSGKHYSKRIWQDTKALEDMLDETVTSSLMSGRGLRRTAEEIQERLGVSLHSARRLVRTETTYVANTAELRAYDAAGINEYQYMATLDMRTSKVCQEQDGKVFAVKDAVVGENLPPLHPHCRSTTVAWFGADELEGMQRRARDPVTGESVLVPRDMTYADWLKMQEASYGKERVDLARKMTERRGADAKQFAEYQALLGKKNLPKTLIEFQQAKYGDSGVYDYWKLDHRRRNALLADPSRALPNVELATVAKDKFTGYIFNPDNPIGWAKGVAFSSRLGYNADNWNTMRNEVFAACRTSPATRKDETPYGTKYTQNVVLYGVKGKPMSVKVAWMVDGSKTWLTTLMPGEVRE